VYCKNAQNTVIVVVLNCLKLLSEIVTT
jgi:hypothetical protein